MMDNQFIAVVTTQYRFGKEISDRETIYINSNHVISINPAQKLLRMSNNENLYITKESLDDVCSRVLKL